MRFNLPFRGQPTKPSFSNLSFVAKVVKGRETSKELGEQLACRPDVKKLWADNKEKEILAICKEVVSSRSDSYLLSVSIVFRSLKGQLRA